MVNVSRNVISILITALRKVQAREVGKSRSKRATEPDYWFEKILIVIETGLNSLLELQPAWPSLSAYFIG